VESHQDQILDSIGLTFLFCCCSELENILYCLSEIDNRVMGDLKMMALEAAFQTYTSTNKMILDLKVSACAIATSSTVTYGT
jgi:hypothetical protein